MKTMRCRGMRYGSHCLSLFCWHIIIATPHSRSWGQKQEAPLVAQGLRAPSLKHLHPTVVRSERPPPTAIQVRQRTCWLAVTWAPWIILESGALTAVRVRYASKVILKIIRWIIPTMNARTKLCDTSWSEPIRDLSFKVLWTLLWRRWWRLQHSDVLLWQALCWTTHDRVQPVPHVDPPVVRPHPANQHTWRVHLRQMPWRQHHQQ